MTDDMTGPWVLALGTLAVGAAAMVRLARRRRERSDDRESAEGEEGDARPQS
jgi:MYXO-CTERM domain-containing protein